MSSSDEVQSKIQELEALRKESGWWRLGGTLAILAIIMICMFKLYGGIKSLAVDGPEQKLMMTKLKEGFDARIKPDLQLAAKEAQTKATAVFKAELEKMSDRLPEFTEKAQSEAMILAEELQGEADKVLDETYGVMLEQSKARINKRYPQVNPDNIANAVENLQTAIEAELAEIVEEMFIDHLIVIDSIVMNIGRIYEDDEVDLLDKDAPWEMGLLVFEIVREEFAGAIDEPSIP